MDIVALSGSSRSKQKRPRRHTTEVRIEQLPNWNEETKSKEKTSTLPSNTSHFPCGNVELKFEDSLSQEDGGHLVPIGGLSRSGLTASLHSLEGGSDEESEPGSEKFHGSQGDLLQEMRVHAMPNHLMAPKHGYQLSYELALDNMLTPFVSPASPPYGMTPTTYTGHVILEIVTTERTYVGDLTDILEGYIVPLESRVGSLELTKADIDSLFGNVKSIRDFNRSFHQTLKACGESTKKVGQCFRERAEGFKTYYSQYCNNYPNSIQVLTRLSQDTSISRFLKICQQRLNHMLPLGAYLLKPVQRVLKYSLLLGQMVKHMSVEEEGFPEATSALDKMTTVSKHINEMKKRYDAAIHIQELQSLLRGSEDIDLTKCGDLVLEENFRYGSRASGPTIRGRTDRFMYVFLFRKLMLMTKKEDDGYQYKAHLEMKDIQLTERVEKEPNAFQIRQVSSGRFFTLQAPNVKTKEKWVKSIKVLLMESIPGLPDKAKMLIMAGFPTDFGEVVKHSPRSPHRKRHMSEQMTVSPFKADQDASRNGTSRQNRNTISVSRPSKAKPAQRSTTTPSLWAERLVQASLLATLQLEPQPKHQPIEEVEEKEEEQKEKGQKVEVKNLEKDKKEEVWERKWAVMEPNEGQEKEQGEVQEEENEEEEGDKKDAIKKRGWSIEEQEQKTAIPTVTITVPADQIAENSETGAQEQAILLDSSTEPHDIVEEVQVTQPQNQMEEHKAEHDMIKALPDCDVAETVSEAGSTTSSQMAKLTVGLSSQENTPCAESPLGQRLEEDEPIQLTHINYAESDSGPGLEVIAPTVESRDNASTDYSMENKSQEDFSTQLGNIIEPPSMFQGSESDVELNVSTPVYPASLEQCNVNRVFTEEDENLFDDLMTKRLTPDSHIAPKSQGVDLNEAQVLQTLLHGHHDSASESEPSDARAQDMEPPIEFTYPNMVEDKKTTPKGTPSSIHYHTPPTTASPVPRNYFPSSATADTVSPFEDMHTLIDPPREFLDEDFAVASRTPPVIKSLPVGDGPSLGTGRRQQSSVVRRHSYSSQHQRRIMHQRKESKSSGSSPEESPTAVKKEKRSSAHSKAKRHASFSKGSISVVGLISTTRTDLSLEDSYISILEPETIVPPPEQFMTNEREQEDPESIQENVLESPRVISLSRSREASPSPKSRHKYEGSPSSIFRFARVKKQSSSLATSSSPVASSVVQSKEYPVKNSNPLEVPYEGNPDERLSFDEILRSYDHYASATGKTTRTKSQQKKRSSSPELSQKDKKKKKKRKRSMTIANIDSETVLAAKEAMAKKDSPPDMPRERSGSKVQQLAREYSKKIKEHQRGNWFKRFSTVVEETEDMPQETEPEWLQKLREKRSKGSSQESQNELTPPTQEQAELAVMSSYPTGRGSEHKADTARKSRSLMRLNHGESSVAVMKQHAADHEHSTHLLRSRSTDFELDRVDSPDPAELEKKGGLKGWVKSLVVRFSGSK